MPRRRTVQRWHEDRIPVRSRRPSALPGHPLTREMVQRGFAKLSEREQILIREQAHDLLQQGCLPQAGLAGAIELLAAVGRWQQVNDPLPVRPAVSE